MDSPQKRLYLIRHAKSDWGSPAITDHDRPLARRGVKAAKLMGRFLTAAGEVPEAVLSSTALRARRTAELMAGAGGWDVEIATTRAFYESDAGRVVEELRRHPGGESLLVVGHEPTWSTLAGRLTGGSNVRMTTAALVRIDFDLDSWAKVAEGRGRLVWMVTPRLLGAVPWKGKA